MILFALALASDAPLEAPKSPRRAGEFHLGLTTGVPSELSLDGRLRVYRSASLRFGVGVGLCDQVGWSTDAYAGIDLEPRPLCTKVGCFSPFVSSGVSATLQVEAFSKGPFVRPWVEGGLRWKPRPTSRVSVQIAYGAGGGPLGASHGFSAGVHVELGGKKRRRTLQGESSFQGAL